MKLSAVLALFVAAGSAQAQIPLAIALFDYDAKSGQAQFDVVNQSGQDITGGAVGFFRNDELVSSFGFDITPGMIVGNEPIHPGGAFHMSQAVRSRRDGSIPQSVEVKPVAVIYLGGKSEGDQSAVEGTFRDRRAMASEFQIWARALEHVRMADLNGVLKHIRAARKIAEDAHTLDRHPAVLATVEGLCEGVQRRVQDGSTTEAEAMQFLRDYVTKGAKIMAAEGARGTQ